MHRDTILRLMVKVGEGCAMLLDDIMVDLPCKVLELDELWAFVKKKERHVTPLDDASRVGHTWTWVAFDRDTKIIPAFRTGKRDEETCVAFVDDLASRLRNRVQITTDGLRMYVAPIAESFKEVGVDYARLHKTYEIEPAGPGRYSPPKVVATEKEPIFGEPVTELVSTSFVERMNLTLRTELRRFTRLTNGHSKKLENHIAAIALYIAFYNLGRRHTTIRVTPGMEAGVTKEIWDMSRIVDTALEYRANAKKKASGM